LFYGYYYKQVSVIRLGKNIKAEIGFGVGLCSALKIIADINHIKYFLCCIWCVPWQM
jgi:hypothetical protein